MRNKNNFEEKKTTINKMSSSTNFNFSTLSTNPEFINAVAASVAASLTPSGSVTSTAPGTSTVQVPVDMLDEVQKFIAMMRINSQSSAAPAGPSAPAPTPAAPAVDAMEEDTPVVETYGYYEAKKVVDHRVNDDGTLSFNVLFNKDYYEWVHENHCRCAELISDYFREKGITVAWCLCRVSTKSQAGPNTVSLDAQKAETYKVAVTLNKTLIRVLKVSSSAYKSIPTAIKQVCESTNPGDAILFYRVDRLSRNVVDCIPLLEGMNTRGVSIMSVTEKLTYSENKTAFIEKMVDSQKESDLLSTKIRMANQAKRDRGDEHIGSVAYGKKYYRKPDGSKGVCDNDEELATIVRIRSYRVQGIKPVDIAEILNNDGNTKRGRKWSASMISYICR